MPNDDSKRNKKSRIDFEFDQPTKEKPFTKKQKRNNHRERTLLKSYTTADFDDDFDDKFDEYDMMSHQGFIKTHKPKHHKP